MNPNLLYLLPPSPFVLLSPLSAAMDPYFHHSRHPNTYIPLSPPYNHHHLRQVSNHVLVNPTAFNFNPPVFLPANPLFVPQVPVLFEHDSRHRSSMLSQSPSNSNPRRSASRFKARDSSLETTTLELDRYDYDRADRVHEYNGISKKQVKSKSVFLRIQAPKPSNGKNEDDEQLHCDDCAVVDSLDVMLHDLDSANAQPQGGQESIDECKQWIWWLRSTGTESIDECCASTSHREDDFIFCLHWFSLSN
ncbi:uncharacterized protein DS421_11g329340 [Arachis hypogaea]|nr:uncharacterized protein DS421_11g329340 [Arachis hypogaea]